MPLNFTPCDDKCPAVTGRPYNSIRYCPMAEPGRHQHWKDIFKMLTYGQSLNAADQHEDCTDCCANFQCCLPD